MLIQTESIVGFVVDMICLREWPVHEIYERASRHERECALQGNHVESGYAIIQDDQVPVFLDPEATPLILEILLEAALDRGLRVRVERELIQNSMRTVLVSEA